MFWHVFLRDGRPGCKSEGGEVVAVLEAGCLRWFLGGVLDGFRRCFRWF